MEVALCSLLFFVSANTNVQYCCLLSLPSFFFSLYEVSLGFLLLLLFFFLSPAEEGAYTSVCCVRSKAAASPNRVFLFFFLTFALKSSHVVLPRARQLRLLHCAFSSQGSAVDENAHRDSLMLLIRRNTRASVSFGPNYRYRQSWMFFFFFFFPFCWLPTFRKKN